MVEITLFEFNLDAEDLIANAPFSSGRGDDAADADADDAGDRDGVSIPVFAARKSDDEDADEAAGGSGGPPVKPLLVGAGLLALVLAVVAGRRLIGGEPEPLP